LNQFWAKIPLQMALVRAIGKNTTNELVLIMKAKALEPTIFAPFFENYSDSIVSLQQQ
jgi:hypothetical protein